MAYTLSLHYDNHDSIHASKRRFIQWYLKSILEVSQEVLEEVDYFEVDSSVKSNTSSSSSWVFC